MRESMLERERRLRNLAGSVANEALTAQPASQSVLMAGAVEISNEADRVARSRKKKAAPMSPVLVLPSNATENEIRDVRRSQSVRTGSNVYLPFWPAIAQIIPSSFLRCALFASSKQVQSQNDLVLAGEKGIVVTDKKITSRNDITITLSGYELCQFDRQVYSACLSYYRDEPLAPHPSSEKIKTTFYALATRLGSGYTSTTHRAIRASLLRLSFAQLRMRYDEVNYELPKLLAVSFEDKLKAKGSDIIWFQVTESVAELFGPGKWTAVDSVVSDYDGLKGWLANFYASHSEARWLDIENLRELSGYKSKMSHFRVSLISALEQLKSDSTPICSKIAKFDISTDGASIKVTRSAWTS